MYLPDLMRRLQLLNSLWSVIIVQASGGVVFGTFLFMGYFMAVDRELEVLLTVLLQRFFVNGLSGAFSTTRGPSEATYWIFEWTSLRLA